jgi:MscS family membrane protein
MRFGEQFSATFLTLALWQWLGLAILLVVSLLANGATQLIVRRILGLRERFLGSKFSKVTLRGLRRGSGLLVLTFIWYAALPSIELTAGQALNVRYALEALTIVAGVLIVLGLWDAICEVIAHRSSHVDKAERLLVPVTRKLVRVIILIIGLLVTLGTFGVNVTGLIAGLGIGGLVVALAAKDSVENIFGSLTILFDMPFSLGDWVKIDKVEGVVEEINLRSTRIRTFEDSMITLPNSNLIKASVENFGARRFRRQKLSVRFAYDSKLESLNKFVDTVREYLEKGQSGAMEGRSVVHMNDLSETSIGVLVQCFFEVESYNAELKLREALMVKILLLARELKLEFVPAPHPKEA